MKAFWAFNEETFKAGAIDVLHKQLMAVAVALTTQCPYCIELHMKAARKAGATDTMLTEAAIVAAECGQTRRSPTRRTCSKSSERKLSTARSHEELVEDSDAAHSTAVTS